MIAHNYAARLDALRSRMRETGLDHFLVTRPANLRYLLSFTGSEGVALIRRDRVDLLVDSRYIDQAGREVSIASVQQVKRLFGTELQTLLGSPGLLGIEARHLTVDLALQLKDWQWKTLETYDWVETIRMVKEDSELAAIRKACNLARKVLNVFVDDIPFGCSETEAAALLEYEARKAGSEGVPFPPILAVGHHSALPHWRPGKRSIDSGEVLLVDFGSQVEGYCSDLTRTYTPSTRLFSKLRKILEEAQEATQSAVRPGISAAQADAAAREVIERSGYGDMFRHGTGHGIGLEVHELPHISSLGNHKLTSGMVFTIEPGIYLPDRFGIRLEDMFFVTRTGCERL